MHPFEFVLIILGMIFAFSLIKSRMEPRGQRRDRGPLESSEDNSENLRLHEEVQELKERLKVLERITVERENTLAQQIEELRER